MWQKLLLLCLIVCPALLWAEGPIGIARGRGLRVNGKDVPPVIAVFPGDTVEAKGTAVIRLKNGGLIKVDPARAVSFSKSGTVELLKRLHSDTPSSKPKNPTAVSHVCENASDQAKDHAASPSVPATCPDTETSF